MKYTLPVLLILILVTLKGLSQQSISVANKITGFPNRFIEKLNGKTSELEAKLDKQTVKYLQRLARQERKLKRNLARTDSAAANTLFDDAQQEYAHLIDQYSGNSPLPVNQVTAGKYLPNLDSLKTSLSFLEQHSELLVEGEPWKDKLQGSLGQLKELQSKLQQTEQVKTFIRERKEQIKETLSRYAKLPKGITKEFGEFNANIYYYQQQVNEYWELLNNPDRLTERVLNLLNRFDAFKRFMQEHSELAGLFGTPANYGTPQALAGLQTRAQVQQLVQTQLSAAGPNLPAGQAGAQQILQQNIQQAQAQLSQLKEKINKLGGLEGAADLDLPPNFKPNNQKTKSFWKRLEYGTNLQSTQSNYFFPATTDFGLSVGYKLNDKNVIGIGASYKVGWGKDIRHIDITSEGMGIRSFADIKLKGSFFLYGGYEYNYQPTSQILRIVSWQQSGLIGMSKIVSLRSKVFKKTKLQLLWDFLSYQQTPRTQAVKFRVGYNF